MTEPTEYYNKFQKKLLTDYLNGNPRATSAIQEMIDRKPQSAKNVLEIGCGIGWASYYLHRNFRDIKIVAVDLSNKSIDIAKKIFSAQNIIYQQKDVTQADFDLNEKFDYIVMLDVFEHIHQEHRQSFIEALMKISSEDCHYFFSCPTKYHQDFLKINKPEGLQPVDESISLAEMVDFAVKSGGEVVYFENKAIWNTNDYFHCLIAKKVKYVDIKYRTKQIPFETRKERIARVFSSEIRDYFDDHEKQSFEYSYLSKRLKTKANKFIWKILQYFK